MKSNITQLQKIFFGVFLASCAAVFAYHYFYVWPKERCADRGGAWAEKWMKCGTVYPIERLTMRPSNLPRINTDPRKMEGPSVSRPSK